MVDVGEHRKQNVAVSAFGLYSGEDVGLQHVDFAVAGESLRIHTVPDTGHTASFPQKAAASCSDWGLDVVLRRHSVLLVHSAGGGADQTGILQMATVVSGLHGQHFSDLGSDATDPEPVAVVDTSSLYTQAEEESDFGLAVDGLRISRWEGRQWRKT